MECHPGFAGYVQAAGVIFTIAVAIFGPPAKLAYDRWMRVRARRYNTRAAAWGTLIQVESVIAAFDSRLVRLRAPTVISEPSWNGFQEELALVVPITLERWNLDPNEFDIDHLTFLVSLGEELRIWNMRTFHYREGLPSRPIEAWKAMVADMIARAEVVRLAAVEAKKTIEAMGKPARRRT